MPRLDWRRSCFCWASPSLPSGDRSDRTSCSPRLRIRDGRQPDSRFRRPLAVRRTHHRAWSRGRSSHHSRDAAHATFRRPVRMEPERRHGLGPARAGRQGNPDPEHTRRYPRRRGRAHRAWVSHRPLGGGPDDGSRSAGTQSAGRDPLRRLFRSLPTRRGVIGVATCDKGLPAMMMALASMHDLPCVLAPGGVTLAAAEGEDAGRVQSVGARFAHNQITLEEAAENLCRACATPGGGCQFLGTAATSQVAAEALGMSLTHSALSPSGHPIWLDMARRSARAALALEARGLKMRHILTDASVRNAMVVHAAFGGSTNLILHLPAVAHAAGLQRPTAADWTATNRRVARLVDALPNGPRSFATVQVFLAGGVPEVMLHLRRAGLLDTGVLTVSGQTLDATLDWWEASSRRAELRRVLRERDGIDPDEVIMDPSRAARAGLTSTVTFPHGNLAPEGSVIKSTAIDPSVVGPDGVYRKTGPARVFRTEAAAIAAIKSQGPDRVHAGDIVVLICRGPMGSGMEETYQITSALKYLDFGKHVAVLTDARFSGVSTGACIGHISPEALAGGPIGKVLDGDVIEILVDRVNLEGSVNVVGHGADVFGAAEGERVLAARPMRADMAPDPALPQETRLWAALQQVSGGTWGGCVYDTEAILKALEA